MIKYNLVCNDCNYSFDSWFSSSKEYDKIRDLYLLVCSKCSSKKIEKSLMSPNILTTVRKEKKDSDSAKISKIKSKIKEYQKFIKSNFEYVGDDFPYVARTIHYDKKKKSKGIYGKASSKDIEELNDEGIDTTTVPWFNEQEN